MEVAALRITGGFITERFVSLVNSGVRVPTFITGMTGITQDMVDAASPVSAVMPELLRFIGSDMLAAHNASFDAKFLLAESRMQGLLPRHSGLLCSLKLARRVFPGMPSYRLGTLGPALGIQFHSAAHRAEADAEVAAKLLLQIGAHLTSSCGMPAIPSSLLQAVSRLAASQVRAFLESMAAQWTQQA